jgi:photosynthetic reaction center cytochrome c subunit
MRTIAGRENEPAGTVFKNVKILKNMPAGEFLKNMDVNYGRGLGMGCGNCHVVGQFAEDTRKNKRVAREMQQMADYINGTQLANIKELDEDYVKVTCVTCHMGSGHPKNTMAVPQPTTAPPQR